MYETKLIDPRVTRFRARARAALRGSLCALCCWMPFAVAGEAGLGEPVTPRSVTVPEEQLAPSPDAGGVTVPEGEPLPSGPITPSQPIDDPSIQLEDKPGADSKKAPGPAVPRALGSPLVNVPGMSPNVNPPDTVGDVGPNHYIQMVNVTDFQIFNKAGVSLLGPADFGLLFPVGTNCRSNTGDPIVVYDHLADRWLLSQFAFPNHMCIAISQTPDPVAGTWFTYEFDVGVFPDYPKFGVWPNAYYMSSYEFPNLGVYAFDRTNMLAGAAAGFVKQTLPVLAGAPGVRDTRILPADLDGPAPPVGTPGIFVRTVDDLQDLANPTDRIEVYTATPVFAAPTSLTFTLVNTLAPAAFQIMVCNRNGQGVRDCIPQPGQVDTLDALSNRPMMQLKFRRFHAHWSMVFNQTIDVGGSIAATALEVAGIRWYELRKTTGNWFIHQQGTYAPQPAGATESQLLHRWMGSAAMDKSGNIAIGYSVTNSDAVSPVFAGIRYTGRHVFDLLGQLPAGEQTILAGVNAQGNANASVEPQRWGDYSALSVDPTDDCTFWYTNHVAGAGGTGARPTRIASFKFSNCGVPVLCGRATANIVGSNSSESIAGTQGRDIIQAFGGNDIVSGLGGNDVICGGKGNDKLTGGKGSDTLRGGKGNDKLRGGKGKDRLFGESGNDAMSGGTGTDLCDGGTGIDTASTCEFTNSVP
ncbi:MAG: calcium-binding protein [Gammaproteobacteria bacterium]